MREKSISTDRRKYLRKIKREKIITLMAQILLLVAIIVIWEVAANKGLIDSFITSQPSRILNTFMNLRSNGLAEHIGITCLETIIGFLAGTFLGTIIAIILWYSKFLSKVFKGKFDIFEVV